LRVIDLGSQHVVASANNVWQGFISSEDPEVFFEDISKNTFKNIINELETLVGDAILVSSVNYCVFHEDSSWTV
jgi:hypothetical protein